MITKTYLKFIDDDFEDIKEEFEKLGMQVVEEKDFCTYDGWKERGRKVKRGSKGLTLQTSNAYSQPLWRNGYPLYDESGKRRFAKFNKSFCLFHIEQTEELKV